MSKVIAGLYFIVTLETIVHPQCLFDFVTQSRVCTREWLMMSDSGSGWANCNREIRGSLTGPNATQHFNTGQLSMDGKITVQV